MPKQCRLPSVFDVFMYPCELILLNQLRRRVIPYLSGQVLEIGVGTGVNLPLYAPATQVTGLEIDPNHLAHALQRKTNTLVRLLRADAVYLPFKGGLYDHVVSTLVFCSLTDPQATLTEIQRVLKPGGWLTLIEHVRGETGLTRSLTDILDKPWHRFSKSCHLNRDTADIIAQSGLRVVCAPRYLFGLFQIILARNP
ncbi:MAG: class I SAM-dependent methyltransferase [Anaerolineae bacterium]